MHKGGEDEWADAAAEEHRPIGHGVDAPVDRPVDSYLSVNPQPLSFENRDPVLAQVHAPSANANPGLSWLFARRQQHSPTP